MRKPYCAACCNLHIDKWQSLIQQYLKMYTPVPAEGKTYLPCSSFLPIRTPDCMIFIAHNMSVKFYLTYIAIRVCWIILAAFVILMRKPYCAACCNLHIDKWQSLIQQYLKMYTPVPAEGKTYLPCSSFLPTRTPDCMIFIAHNMSVKFYLTYIAIRVCWIILAAFVILYNDHTASLYIISRYHTIAVA